MVASYDATMATVLPADVRRCAWVHLDAALPLRRHQVGLGSSALRFATTELAGSHVLIERGNAFGRPCRLACGGCDRRTGPAWSRQLLECHARRCLMLAV